MSEVIQVYKNSTLGLPSLMPFPILPTMAFLEPGERKGPHSKVQHCIMLQTDVNDNDCVGLGHLRSRFQDGIKCPRNILWETPLKKRWRGSQRRLGKPSKHDTSLTQSGEDREGRKEGKRDRNILDCHSALRKV